MGVAARNGACREEGSGSAAEAGVKHMLVGGRGGDEGGREAAAFGADVDGTGMAARGGEGGKKGIGSSAEADDIHVLARGRDGDEGGKEAAAFDAAVAGTVMAARGGEGGKGGGDNAGGGVVGKGGVAASSGGDVGGGAVGAVGAAIAGLGIGKAADSRPSCPDCLQLLCWFNPIGKAADALTPCNSFLEGIIGRTAVLPAAADPLAAASWQGFGDEQLVVTQAV
eukprot:1160964-Pelagomonas_calceolata.AAC.9